MLPSYFTPGNNNSSPRQPTATEDQDRCNLDVYSLVGDSVGVVPVRPQQPIATRDNRLPRITAMSRPQSRQFQVDQQERMLDSGRQTRLLSNESEAPFSRGICRQLAAMYTDVGMTTVERVRWLCGWMILMYALTCCAWFAWPAYTVPAVGILTGTAGLLACQRPHDQNDMTYVLAFLALNYAQLALLVWMVFIALPAEITSACIKNCAGAETKAVFIVMLVLATGIFHWRVVTITRHYVREFRMIQQLAIRGSQVYLDASYSSATASSTMVTDTQSRSSGSAVSLSVLRDLEHESTIHVPHAGNPQATRM